MENKFEWRSKYSSTDKPDKQNRWGRVCVFRGYRIAYIDKLPREDDAQIFEVYDYFPFNDNDMPHYTVMEHNLEIAKKNVEKRFTEFLNNCCK